MPSNIYIYTYTYILQVCMYVCMYVYMHKDIYEQATIKTYNRVKKNWLSAILETAKKKHIKKGKTQGLFSSHTTGLKMKNSIYFESFDIYENYIKS